jgi:hypothetical protein
MPQFSTAAFLSCSFAATVKLLYLPTASDPAPKHFQMLRFSRAQHGMEPSPRKHAAFRTENLNNRLVYVEYRVFFLVSDTAHTTPL